MGGDNIYPLPRQHIKELAALPDVPDRIAMKRSPREWEVIARACESVGTLVAASADEDGMRGSNCNLLTELSRGILRELAAHAPQPGGAAA